jgi:DNA-binding transcriptional regulator YhcF (GntR family)
MDDVFKNSRIKIQTHRGEEDTLFGKHARIPFKLDTLDSKSLLILAFIDIDQFLDSNYKLKGSRRVLTLETFENTLRLSKNTVRKSLKELEKYGAITSKYSRNLGTSYISNILKLNIRYQIITYSFISRQDLSHTIKAFILKVIMLGEVRISNIRNITALVKETGVSRRILNKILQELNDRGYILDNETEEGIQVLDVKGIMLDSEEKLLLEHRELRAKVSTFCKFASFEDEIARLNDKIAVLLKKIELLKNGSNDSNKKT